MKPADNRYEPLPSFTKLPGWLWGKLSPREQRQLGIATALVAALLAVFLTNLILVGRKEAADERAREAAYALQKKRDLREDQRPRRARLEAGVAPAQALESEITADVQARVRAGLLEGPVVGTSCTPIGNAPDAFNCFTLSSRRKSTHTIESGYRFSAKANTATGALAWCKRNPRPLHPETEDFLVLPVSKDCLP
jgi:hypothetical protein